MAQTMPEHNPAPTGLAPRPLPPEAREPWPSFLRTMGWVGLNSFGGPVAQIGVMREEAVDRRQWLTDDQFVHLLNFANVLPGPEALELAIHLGWLRRGVAGGVVAGLLFVLPGFLALTALGWIYQTWGTLAGVRDVLAGVRPVAAALIVFAVARLADRSLRGPLAWTLMAVAFVAHAYLDAPFLGVLLGGGALGMLLKSRRNRELRADPRWLLLLIGLALASGYLWLGPRQGALAGLATAGTVQASLPELAVVHTETALVTFGGAYTALPYLREQYVEVHRWLTDVQVVDGLALGETTPGPLLCVGVFLAYLAGGPLGAVVGTFFLFLPSFLLVLGLARHVERIENLPKMRDFLWGVSAATVGLVLALSSQVVPASVPLGPSVGLAGLALAALWRWRVPAVAAVGGGAAVGLLAGQWLGG